LKFTDIAVDLPWRFAPEHPVVGLDIGSRGSKGVLLTADEIHTTFIATGLYMQETADELLARLLQQTGLARRDVTFVVGTGYGRISLAYEDIPYQVVTEITCHALGAHALNPRTRTIIDIGGQDSKAIKVDPATGKVVQFVMNDKCAAGTGRFLEKAAVLLGLGLDELGPVALAATEPAQISSQCVVFAESEMISLRARGERHGDGSARANIAAGIHYASARRVKTLLGRVGTEPDLVFTGGVANNVGMRKAMEDLIGRPFADTPIDMIYAGALGAAVQAGRLASARSAAHTPANGHAGLAHKSNGAADHHPHHRHDLPAGIRLPEGAPKAAHVGRAAVQAED
jgi:predicted CoA-substrate-specific enzyme activase